MSKPWRPGYPPMPTPKLAQRQRRQRLKPGEDAWFGYLCRVGYDPVTKKPVSLELKRVGNWDPLEDR